MKIAALLFLTLLIGFHCLDGGNANLDRPLSMFREDGLEAVGYVLFGLLLLLGGFVIRPAVRLEHYGGVAVYLVGWLLLLGVVVTPSLDDLHNACAFGLLGLLYLYYAGLLFYGGGFWVLLHLAVPILLVMVTQFHSYGLWQKSVIAYFVIGLAIHHHVLTRMCRQASRTAPPKEKKRTEFGKKRRVYTLAPGKAWKRDRHALEPSQT